MKKGREHEHEHEHEQEQGVPDGLKKDLVCPPSHVISGHKKSNQENAFRNKSYFSAIN